MAKYVSGLSKCMAKASKRGIEVDPMCFTKAHDKFDGGSNPARGCFAKLEQRGGCLTVGDTSALMTAVAPSFVDIGCGFDPEIWRDPFGS